LEFNGWVNAGMLLWARSELRRRWGALLLLAVLVAIGGGTAIAAAAAARRTETAFDRMLHATNHPNLSVLGVGEEGFFDLDPQLLDGVMKIDGVTGAAEYAFMGVAPEGFPNFFALAIIDRRGDAQRAIWLEGTPIEDGSSMGADDLLLNESMRNQLDKGSGDTIVLGSLTPEQFEESLSSDQRTEPGGPTVNARIVGVSRSPEDVSDAPDPFLLLSPAFYDKYKAVIGSCLCDVMINADPQAIDTVMAELADLYPGAQIEQEEDLSGRVRHTVALQRRAWLLIALTAALAGALALFQTSTRVGRLVLAGDDSRRAIGMTRRERRLGSLLVIAPAMVAGTVGAVGVAYVLSPLSPVGLTKLAETSPGLRWDAGVVIPGGVVVLIMSLVVAGAAAIAARPRVERRRGAGSLGGPQLAFGHRLAFGPGRAAIVGVLLSTAGLVGAMTLEHSIDHVLATPALYGADFDASNLLDSGADKRVLAEQLTPDPDVEAVGLVWTQLPSATLVHVVGPGGEADVDPNAIESVKGTVSVRQTRGRPLVRPDEVAVGHALLKQLGASVGDRISATGTNATVQLTIVGDNLDPGVDVAGWGFAMTVDGLMQFVDASIAGTVVRFAPGSDHASMLDRYSDIGLMPVTPPSEVGHIGQLGGLPLRIGQVLLLLGIAALVNAVVLTVRLGRRELAVHRALGFTNAQVVGVHVWQGAVTALVGVVLGSGIGFVVGRTIVRHLVGNVGAIAEIRLPGVLWLVVLGTIAACLCAGLVTSALALRHRPGSELRTE
jgi:hypothetical protein